MKIFTLHMRVHIVAVRDWPDEKPGPAEKRIVRFGRDLISSVRWLIIISTCELIIWLHLIDSLGNNRQFGAVLDTGNVHPQPLPNVVSTNAKISCMILWANLLLVSHALKMAIEDALSRLEHSSRILSPNHESRNG